MDLAKIIPWYSKGKYWSQCLLNLFRTYLAKDQIFSKIIGKVTQMKTELLMESRRPWLMLKR